MTTGETNANHWVVPVLPYSEDRSVQPLIRGSLIWHAAGQSDAEHARFYARQLLAAADELDRRTAAEQESDIGPEVPRWCSNCGAANPLRNEVKQLRRDLANVEARLTEMTNRRDEQTCGLLCPATSLVQGLMEGHDQPNNIHACIWMGGHQGSEHRCICGFRWLVTEGWISAPGRVDR